MKHAELSPVSRRSFDLKRTAAKEKRYVGSGSVSANAARYRPALNAVGAAAALLATACHPSGTSSVSV
jgi:hypothetical protein